MKHQTVYVPVKVEDELPDEGEYFLFAKNKHSGTIGDVCEYHDGDFYMDEDKGYPSNINKIDSWLKPVENVNILTDSELLELKKKWMKEAFDAGYSRCFWKYFDGSASTTVPNGQTFLNSIKLD